MEARNSTSIEVASTSAATAGPSISTVIPMTLTSASSRPSAVPHTSLQKPSTGVHSPEYAGNLGLCLQTMESCHDMSSFINLCMSDSAWDSKKLEEILRKGVNVNRHLSPNARRPLHIASQRGDTEVVQMLLDYGALVNVQDNFKNTSIHFAAEAGNHETVQLLLSRGADVSAKDCKGNTALHKTKSFKVSEVLVSKGVNVNEKNFLHQSALHCIYLAVGVPTETVKDITELLVDNGAVVNGQDKNGHSLLHYAAQNPNSNSLALLIGKGAKLDMKDCRGFTPLHNAVEMDRADNVEYLLNCGALLDEESNDKNTPLLLTAKFNNHRLMLKLLEKGANVYAADTCCKTALHFAATNDNSEMVSSLLAYGASVNMKDRKGQTPNQLPIRTNEQYKTQQLLSKHIYLSQLAGLPVPEQVKSIDIDINKTDCLQELEKMKTTKVCDELYLYDIFSKFKRPSYLFSQEVVKSIETFFQSPDFHMQFPVYAKILKSTFIQSKSSKYCLIRKATTSMMSYKRKTCYQVIPDLVWCLVFEYLSQYDLIKVIRSSY